MTDKERELGRRLDCLEARLPVFRRLLLETALSDLQEVELRPGEILLRKGEEADEIFRFIDFWKRHHGAKPRHLVFDSRLTTYPNLARLDEMGILFITLRRRSAKLLQEIAGLPRSAWRTVELDVPSRKYRTPRVHEQKVRLAGRTYRQLFIQDLGHDEPTILVTNEARTSHAKLITRYAQRMLIENALSDAVRFFHMDALSSAVGLKVDFDMALLGICSGIPGCESSAGPDGAGPAT